jgi:hypothetical protein
MRSSDPVRRDEVGIRSSPVEGMSRMAGLWRPLVIAPLSNPGVHIGLLISVLLVVGAYQVRPTYDVPIGTATDAPLLRDFNTAEVMQGARPITYRWTAGNSHIVLSDIGRQDLTVTLTVAGARPADQPPPHLTVQSAGRTVLDVRPPHDLTDYSFAVPRDLVKDGTLDLHINSNVFTPTGDPNPRPLGVLVAHLLVVPGANPDRFIEPPSGVVAAILGTAALIGLLLALLGWGTGATLLGTVVSGALAASLLAFDRFWLTSGQWYAAWLQAALVGGLLVVIARPVVGRLFRGGRIVWSATQRRALLTLMFAAFVVRLAGQLHPEIFIVDLGFHQHRLDTVESGQLLFTIKSAEWGGHDTFYLPTAYIFMLPLQWLLADSALVIKLLTVALGTLGAIPVYVIGQRVLRGAPGGMIASALYLSLPIAILPFSWGITTNVFGDFWALCSLAIAVCAYSRLAPNTIVFWALVFTLLMALLSHPGVVLLTAVAFGLAGLLWVVFGRNIETQRRGVWVLGALAVSAVASYLLYYQHFASQMVTTLGQIRAERGASAPPGGLDLLVGGSVADQSLGLVVRRVHTWGDWLRGGLAGFWHEAVAYYRAWPVLGSVLGVAVIWTGRTRRAERVRWVLAAAAWLLVVLFFALVGWLANLYVRYSLFALSIVALGTGMLLATLWVRTRAGQWLALLVLLYFAAFSLALWQYRINYALK